MNDMTQIKTGIRLTAEPVMNCKFKIPYPPSLRPYNTQYNLVPPSEEQTKAAKALENTLRRATHDGNLQVEYCTGDVPGFTIFRPFAHTESQMDRIMHRRLMNALVQILPAAISKHENVASARKDQFPVMMSLDAGLHLAGFTDADLEAALRKSATAER